MNKKLTKKDFFAEVITEVEHLKKTATQKEIGRLDFSTLDATNYQLCIYGQMTGDCHSDRAVELANKKYEGISKDGGSFTEWNNSIYSAASKDISPLEVYITLKGAKNKSLIAYLKGERASWKP